MSTRALIENDLMDLLFKRVEKFVKKGHIKSTVGFNFIDGYLIIDIGNEKTIHINPAKKIIKLVDTLTGSVEDLSYYELTTVQWFFKSVDEKMTNISRVEGNDSFQRLIDFFYKIDSKELFFSTELSYYKSLFSGHLTTFCFNPRGEYSFKVSKNHTLHVYISRVYLDDQGLYFLENQNQPVSTYVYEPHCSEKILVFLKELCKKPEDLKNLATV